MKVALVMLTTLLAGATTAHYWLAKETSGLADDPLVSYGASELTPRWSMRLDVRLDLLHFRESLAVSNHKWGVAPDSATFAGDLPFPVAEFTFVFVPPNQATDSLGCRYSLTPRLTSDLLPEEVAAMLGEPPASLEILANWSAGSQASPRVKTSARLYKADLSSQEEFQAFKEEYAIAGRTWFLTALEEGVEGRNRLAESLNEWFPLSSGVSSIWGKVSEPPPNLWTERGNDRPLPTLLASHPLERELVCARYMAEALGLSTLLPHLFPEVRDLASTLEVLVWDGNERKKSPYGK